MKNTVINELLASFNEISGMEIYVMDAQMRVVGFARKHSSRLCAALHDSPAAVETCRASDKELFELAREAEGARNLHARKASISRLSTARSQSHRRSRGTKNTKNPPVKTGDFLRRVINYFS